MEKRKFLKLISAFSCSLCLMFSLANVHAATVTKTKTKNVTTTNGSVVKVNDTGKKNNTTGSWSFSVGCIGLSVPSGFSAHAYASKLGTNPVLTNNGNTAKHSVVVSITRDSSGQSAGGQMTTFTFTYNPSTGKIS